MLFPLFLLYSRKLKTLFSNRMWKSQMARNVWKLSRAHISLVGISKHFPQTQALSKSSCRFFYMLGSAYWTYENEFGKDTYDSENYLLWKYGSNRLEREKKASSIEPPGGPVVKASPSNAGGEVWSLVREWRSHMSLGKQQNKKTETILPQI